MINDFSLINSHLSARATLPPLLVQCNHVTCAAGVYTYAHSNGDMDVVEVEMVVLPALVVDMNFWIGQQVSLTGDCSFRE